jgi:hypothetical protein
MKTFAKNLTTLMPEGITLPSDLVEAFDWLEDQGWLHVRKEGAPEDHWLSLYPPEFLSHLGASHVNFGGTTVPYTHHWPTPDTAVDNRIAEIGVTSGDGGRVAIWLDETGKQQFVHIGHDSLGMITDDPLILLQFLAMGYPEAGALERTDVTPLQAALDYHGVKTITDLDPSEQPVAPIALQRFLKQRFDLDMPATARDLGVSNFPEYHDTETNDPFAKWISSATPELTEEELTYELELMRTVESLDLNDTDSSQTIMDKIGTLFETKN